MLIKDFLMTSTSSNTPSPLPITPNSSAEREAVQICIIGSLEGITGIIYDLHRRGFAEVDEWSKPQPTGRSGEYIRLIRRYILARS